MDAPLLATKLYVPRPRGDLVPRARLVDALSGGLWRGDAFARRLTLVSAPAGFGKTTLLAHWLADLEKRADETSPLVAWVSLDRDDNDLQRFLAYLVGAFRQAQAGVLSETHARLVGPGPTLAKTILTLLINELVALPRPALLVLDDYHAIADDEVHGVVAYLVENLPPTAHVVMATRTDPSLPIALWRSRRQMAELRARDLRFSPGETVAFLNEMMGLDLDGEDVRLLERRTEGWIAGLQLAALSLREASPEGRSAFLRAFGGSHRHIIDYLAEQVMDAQEPDVHDFMCQISVLEQFCAPLCDAVTGRSDSDALLRRMDAENLFVVALDDERRWYRYHHLFADFVRHHLRQQHPGLAVDLLDRASRWCEAEGDLASAVDYALEGEAHDRAANLIAQAAESVLKRSQIATFERWVTALPPQVLERSPRLRMFHAWALVMGGFPLGDIETHLPSAAPTQASGEDRSSAVRAYILALSGNAQEALEMCDQALAEIDNDDDFMSCVLHWNRGMYHMVSGGLDEAAEALRQAAALGRGSGNILVATAALCHLAELLRARCELPKSYELYREALTLAEEGGDLMPIAGMPLMGMGEIEREWNQRETARAHLQQGLELTARWGRINMLDGWISLAAMAAEEGDAPRCYALLDQGADVAARFDLSDWDDALVAAARALCALVLEDLPVVEAWVAASGVERIDVAKPGNPTKTLRGGFASLDAAWYLLYARYLHTCGRARDALALAEAVVVSGGYVGVERMHLGARCTIAMARRSLGQEERAREELVAVLAEAMPQRIVRFIVDHGRDMGRLLREVYRDLAADDPLRDYVARLVLAAEADGRETSDGGGAIPPVQPLLDPLTERELDVVRLVAEGLTNREIADRLVVAVSTVKTHLNRAYAKLGVGNRTEAAARARELDMLNDVT